MAVVALVDPVPPAPATVEEEERLHCRLCKVAAKWLESVGCGVVFKELVTTNYTGEIPDAIGWRGHQTVLVEVKTSRGDFLADKRKAFRKFPELGMGDHRIYLCPPGLIRPEELPPGWGLLYATGERGSRVQRVCGVAKGNCAWPAPAFTGNKQSEVRMLLSAIRRVKIRGLLDVIYEEKPKPVRLSAEELAAADKAWMEKHGVG